MFFVLTKLLLSVTETFHSNKITKLFHLNFFKNFNFSVGKN